MPVSGRKLQGARFDQGAQVVDEVIVLQPFDQTVKDFSRRSESQRDALGKSHGEAGFGRKGIHERWICRPGRMDDLDVIERDFFGDDAAEDFAAFVGRTDGREKLDRAVLEGRRCIFRGEQPGKPFDVGFWCRCG